MTKTTPYDLHEGLGYRLSLVARINQQHFEKMLAEIGLTRQLWCVLVAVGEMKITLPTEIAKYIGINRTSASRSFRQMAKMGLLARQDAVNDGRNNPIKLTAKGQHALATSIPMANLARKHFGERMTPTEQDQLIEILEKLLQGETPPVSGI